MSVSYNFDEVVFLLNMLLLKFAWQMKASEELGVIVWIVLHTCNELSE